MSAAPFLSKSNNKRQYLSREKLRKNVFFRDFNKYPVSRRFDKNGATDMSFNAVSLGTSFSNYFNNSHQKHKSDMGSMYQWKFHRVDIRR